MNANIVTASNGPTMKYHCTVAVAEKNKKTKRYLVTMGEVNMKNPKQSRFVLEVQMLPKTVKKKQLH